MKDNLDEELELLDELDEELDLEAELFCKTLELELDELDEELELLDELLIVSCKRTFINFL